MDTPRPKRKVKAIDYNEKRLADEAFAGSGDDDDDVDRREPPMKKHAGDSVVVLGESNVPMQEVGCT